MDIRPAAPPTCPPERPPAPPGGSADAFEPTWKVRQIRDGDEVTLVGVEPAAPRSPAEGPVRLRSLPALLAEDVPPSRERYEEVLYPDSRLPDEGRRLLQAEARPWPGSEVRSLVRQGPLENRIDLTIVGDGYTDEEKDRFFQDARRITDDLFREKTFAPYLPLFNVHAVFVPSKESGLSDVEEKDTALGLYRSPQGSKRAIMPGNYGNIERALELAPDTDFPILMANDDYYGGLGGRYAITTRSENSGSMVLRHELGHNFGDVGEEYDGGQVYDGANHSSSADVPWDKWVEGENPVVGEARSLVGSYPWRNLSRGPVTMTFDVPRREGNAPTTLGIDLSSVGWETPGDVAVLLDGREQPYSGVFTDDRSFFRLSPELAPGRHTLEIREKIADGDNVLASVRVTAYGKDYDFTPGKVGAFPSFYAGGGQAGYRPTHESCLMRDMRSLDFCSVDRENMWRRFLDRVSLIDDLKATEQPDGARQVRLDTPALEGLEVKWFRVGTDGQEREEERLAGLKEWTAGPGDRGQWRAEVQFCTPDVREYTDRFRASRAVTV